MGNALGIMRSLEGFMGHRLGPIPSIEFHPHKLVLAVGQSRTNTSITNFTNIPTPSFAAAYTSTSSSSSSVVGSPTFTQLNPASSPNVAALSALSASTVASGSMGGLSIPLFASELAGRHAATAKSAALSALDNDVRYSDGFASHDDSQSVRSLASNPNFGGVISSLMGLARNG
ncbi:hypothetical protein HK096_009017, partial [Nowakowskiella sp. JEL0078]